jgi:hypothetical protein
MTLMDSEKELASAYAEAKAQNALRVVAVLGTSFSGSTLLNLILGAHSQIYAGGEMIGLLLHRHKALSGSCTSCGLDCEYWSDDARGGVQKDNIYRLTERIFGKSIIVDTSKSVDWFNEILHSGENVEVRPIYVLMVKHPIRYLASCMINIGTAQPIPRRRTLLSRLSSAHDRKAVLEQWISELSQYYESFLLNLPRDLGGAAFHVVHYEKLVDNPRRAVSPLLETLGLQYEPQLDDFYSASFHQIGGNNGAVYQTKRNWNGGDEGVPEFRRKFYEENRALKIDNKYRDTLTGLEIQLLKFNRTVQRLCDRLGYNHPDMPFAI